MGRRAQEQQLADAEAQEIAYGAYLGGQGPLQTVIDEDVDLSQPAQGRQDHLPGEGPVTVGKSGERGMGVHGLVQRALAAEDGAEKVERHRARRCARVGDGPQQAYQGINLSKAAAACGQPQPRCLSRAARC